MQSSFEGSCDSSAHAGGYLRHHLKLAGCDDTLFSDAAAALLHQDQPRHPPRAQQPAVQALFAAFADQKAIVDESSARAASGEITAE